MQIDDNISTREQLNIYCDESCHLENDKSDFMLLGLIKCEKNKVKEINSRIWDIKQRNGIKGHTEVKWTKVSPKNLKLYMDLIDYFFDCPYLSFKTIVINKNNLKHEEFNQTHEDFYYKIYYTLLQHAIEPNQYNKIFVDEKDTHNSQRVAKLEEFLHQKNYDYNHEIIAPIQIIKSHHIPLMQIVDILLGLMSYFCNVNNKSFAKTELIKQVQRRSSYSLSSTTLPNEPKFNIFYFEGR